jgi:uncharacterized protein (TIGR03084 family)
MGELCDELIAETAWLDDLLSRLDDAGWDAPTPAEGWSVRDQVSHLAFFDDAAVMAMTDPEGFTAMAEAAMSSGADPMEAHLREGRAMAGDALLAWWRTARSSMVGEAAVLRPGARVVWFGPPMGALSFVSARLMETWAHGQDVADALGALRRPTARLRHVAHLGVRARPFSYLVRGRDVPDTPIRVELVAPDGERWVWGDDAVDSIRGSALDFCLVVTQRRNVADTGLEVEGASAADWMAIAQAFAGPPGPGRAPSGVSGH